MPRNRVLPRPRELDSRAKAARERLTALFAKRKDLRGLKEHLALGLVRIEEKRRVSVMFATYMDKHGLSVKELAHRLYIGEDDHLDLLELLRFPSAFRKTTKKQDDHYLINLCDLEWDPTGKCFIPLPL